MRQKLFSFNALKEALRDKVPVMAEVNGEYLGKFCANITMRPSKHHNNELMPAFDSKSPDFSGVYVVNELDFQDGFNDIQFYAIV